MDFLLLVNSTYSSDIVKIEDTCAHCLQRISMVIERGRVTQISPAQTVVFWGGA